MALDSGLESAVAFHAMSQTPPPDSECADNDVSSVEHVSRATLDATLERKVTLANARDIEDAMKRINDAALAQGIDFRGPRCIGERHQEDPHAPGFCGWCGADMRSSAATSVVYAKP